MLRDYGRDTISMVSMTSPSKQGAKDSPTFPLTSWRRSTPIERGNMVPPKVRDYVIAHW
jgi:hypothetical protein